MNRQQTLAKVKEIVKPYIKDQQAFDDLSLSTDFISDLKINSANLVDIILDIEEAFDIAIDNEEMERMLDVQAAVDIIENKLSEKQ